MMLGDIKRIEFDNERLCVYTENQGVFLQPLRDYPRLKNATDTQRSGWKLSNVGIHWEEIDEDVSFESFFYEETDPQIVKAR